MSEKMSFDNPTVLGVHYDALRPEVKAYADHIVERVGAIFRHYGVTDYKQFREKSLGSSGAIADADIALVKELLEKLHAIVSRNTAPFNEFIFVLRNVPHPLIEAFHENGHRPDFVERGPRLVILSDVLCDNQSSYHDMGLMEWEKSIHNALDGIVFTSQEREVIQKELEAGALPIIMPGLATQQKTIAEAVEAITPIITMNGRPRKEFNEIDAVLADTIQKRPDVLLDRTPKSPYLLLMRPTKNADPLLLENGGYSTPCFVHGKREQASRCRAMLLEYLMLQRMYTENAFIMLTNLTKGNTQKSTSFRVTPLDHETTTELHAQANLIQAFSGTVLTAHWGSALELRYQQTREAGIRTATRIPLEKPRKKLSAILGQNKK